MPNRRSFIRTVTGAAAGLAVSRSFPDADAQERKGGQGRGQAPRASAAVTRREVQIGGRRVRVVDVHAHATVDEVKPVVANTEFARNAGGRPLDMERIQEMDRRGIDVQVLSINGYWWYAVKDRALADKIVRAADDGLAAWCKQHPTRFVALTSPSLQFPDLAAAQVERAVNQLGHRGASVGGHVEGESLSSPKFDPFWAKLQDLGVPVFMHPGGADNVLKENAWEGSRGDLGNIIGNPLETTVLVEVTSHLTWDERRWLAKCAAMPIAPTRKNPARTSRTRSSSMQWCFHPKAYGILSRKSARRRSFMAPTFRFWPGRTRWTTFWPQRFRTTRKR